MILFHDVKQKILYVFFCNSDENSIDEITLKANTPNIKEYFISSYDELF